MVRMLIRGKDEESEYDEKGQEKGTGGGKHLGKYVRRVKMKITIQTKLKLTKTYFLHAIRIKAYV